MPTYDYKCDACNHIWEEFQSITAAPTKKCPACKKQKAKRQIGGGGGFIFKGSGFYITDYRSDSYKKAADADAKTSTSSSSTESSSASKSESKPATSDSSSKSTGASKKD